LIYAYPEPLTYGLGDALDFERIRKKRLLQLTFAVAFSLTLIGLAQFRYHFFFEGIVLLASAGLSGSVIYLARNDYINEGANLLIFLLVATLTILLIQGAGLRDIAMFGFVGVVIFSTMIGRPRLTMILLGFITVLCAVYGLLYHLNIIIVPEQITGLETAFSLAVIFNVIGYAIISLHRDLVSAAKTITQENQRVLESKAIIEHLAHHDSLTNLPNRILAKDRLEHAIINSQRNGHKVAVLFLDLDDFKSTNDSLGHDAGDDLLIQAAQRLEARCRELDTICRIGGDEFLIIAEDLQEEWQASKLAQKILKSFDAPFQLQGGTVTCTTSIGIAIAPTDGSTFESLLKKSDIAMYNAKENGRNQFHYFNVQQQEKLQYRIILTNALKRAIETQELELLYQPKIDLATDAIVGAEALLRWHSQDFGTISPTEFIPLAEQNGFIVELGQWVIRRACQDAADFLNQSPGFTMSINVSVAQFKHTSLIQDIDEQLKRYQLPAKTLDIEITESLIADQEATIRDNLAALKARDISISIDDFGTGYSNLGYLKKFNVETLKIDRSFIYELPDNDSNKTIVKAILQICKGLDMSAVAEGVEDHGTIELLKQWGCEQAQGYYWSKPIRKSEFEALMQTGLAAAT